MTIANKGNKPFNMKDLFPVTNLTDQKPSMHMTENTNSIAGLGWKTVASKSLAAVSEVFAPLDRYTTDYTDEIVTFGPGRAVTLTIEIAREVGEALKNPEDWNVSAVKTDAVSIECNRYSRPFLVTSYDMAAGSRLEGKLNKAIETVAKAVLKDLHTQIKTAAPEYVATVLSGLIIPEVSALTVNPTYHAKLTPYNADSLKLETGVYGIGGIYKATGLEALSDDKKTIGYMGYENAIGIISRQPLIPTGKRRHFRFRTGQRRRHQALPETMGCTWDGRGYALRRSRRGNRCGPAGKSAVVEYRRRGITCPVFVELWAAVGTVQTSGRRPFFRNYHQ